MRSIFYLVLSMMLSPDSNAEICKPYSVIADFYDSMMREVEYPKWGDYYEKLFQLYKVPVLYIHDIACGTGSMAIDLYQRGYQVSASDKSPDMIRKARQKNERLGLSISFSVSLMESYRPEMIPDVILCMFDSINYLENEQSWLAALNHVYALLKTGGLFIFDVSTETNSLKNFNRTLEIDRMNHYRRLSWYDQTARIQYNRIEILLDGHLIAEDHRQYIYSLNTIKRIITQTPFSLIGMYDHLTLNSGHENCERVHFVLQKTADRDPLMNRK